jgi:hypothetical protein
MEETRVQLAALPSAQKMLHKILAMEEITREWRLCCCYGHGGDVQNKVNAGDSMLSMWLGKLSIRMQMSIEKMAESAHGLHPVMRHYFSSTFQRINCVFLSQQINISISSNQISMKRTGLCQSEEEQLAFYCS